MIENLPGEFDDPRAYAVMLVAMQTGPLMLYEHVSRALGAGIFSPAGHLRMSKATVDFHSHALVSPEMAAQAHVIFDPAHRPAVLRLARAARHPIRLARQAGEPELHLLLYLG